jgi:hypothetical protein
MRHAPDHAVHACIDSGVCSLSMLQAQHICRTATCSGGLVQIADSLSLPAIRDRPWQIQPCCARTGEGLKEGMEWLIKQVQ